MINDDIFEKVLQLPGPVIDKYFDLFTQINKRDFEPNMVRKLTEHPQVLVDSLVYLQFEKE